MAGSVPAVGAGPVVIAYLLAILSFGMLVAQTYLYFSAFPNDRNWIKTLVYSLFALCTLQAIFSIHDMSIYFGSEYGNVEVFMKIMLGGYTLPIVTGIVSCAVQVFYAYQIYVISRSKIWAGLIVTLALVQMGASCFETAIDIRVKSFKTLRREGYIVASVWLVGSALCDLIIAVLMTIYLLRADSGHSMLGSTSSPLRRLKSLIVQTGTASAAFGITGCILFLTRSDTSFQIPIKPLGNIYVSSLLVILNNRMRIVGSQLEIRPEDLSLHIEMSHAVAHAHTHIGFGGGGGGDFNVHPHAHTQSLSLASRMEGISGSISRPSSVVRSSLSRGRSHGPTTGRTGTGTAVGAGVGARAGSVRSSRDREVFTITTITTPRLSPSNTSRDDLDLESQCHRDWTTKCSCTSISSPTQKYQGRGKDIRRCLETQAHRGTAARPLKALETPQTSGGLKLVSLATAANVSS
ncbi:hypothetical protein D9758_014984 [Tetrapyrgos nigripes]|uniref:DUF6534 domain-containing protein n=1 Tax=Tetrapyrgos nigripes TaxID=182062 RepID=A0A8H5FKI7_9AGAR|nr:hypothetical protein D9758_014984 [Tetrapyrgos nigripes]